MKTVVRRILEMGQRVRDFIRANAPGDASYSTALARIEELLARGEKLAAQQRAGLITSRASAARRMELRRAMEFRLLRHLVKVGKVAAKVRPEMAQQFRLPGLGTTHLAFLTAAKGMLAEAESQKELLVGKGLSETLLADLEKALQEFETSTVTSRAGLRDHTGARSDLDALTSEMLQQVQLLDGLVRYRFGDSAELMGSWESARNVVRPSHRKATPPVVSDGAVPPQSGGVAPAA